MKKIILPKRKAVSRDNCFSSFDCPTTADQKGKRYNYAKFHFAVIILDNQWLQIEHHRK